MIFEKILDSLFDKKVIVNCDKDPYLNRWFLIRTTWIGIFIHKFVRSDEDRALHDHPWSFIVIPIWRGYWEHSEREKTHQEKWDELKFWSSYPVDEGPRMPELHKPMKVLRLVLPIIGTRFRKATFRHRVELFEKCSNTSLGKPAWSIFIRFKRLREWGFWPSTGFIQWNKWWQEKCE